MTGLGLAQRAFYCSTREEAAFLRNHFGVWMVQSSTTLTQYRPSSAASAGCCIATKIGPIELDPSTRLSNKA